MRTIALSSFLPGLPLATLCAFAAAPSQATPQAPAAAQGMTVVRDADTGQLRAPTPAEMRALRAPGAGARPVQPTMQIGPDGRRSVHLGDSRLVYSVVRRGADGTLEQHCAHGPDAAERLLHAAPPAPSTAPASGQGEHHGQR